MGILSKERYKVLIVDDSDTNRTILAEILRAEYEIIEANSGEKAIEILKKRSNEISLVLLDIVMPEMNGYEVLEQINEIGLTEDVPVIMISAESSAGFITKAYDLGAVDYVSRPFESTVVQRRVKNTITLYAKKRRLYELVADQVYEKEKNNNLMISILSHIVEFRNGESGAHVVNIGIITELLLKQLVKKSEKYHLSAADIRMICTASALHDIGKIAIPDKILNKPGRFTAKEYEIMKTHSKIGASMLKDLSNFQDEPLMKLSYEICRWHHERYDGNGYPDGLKGDDIPISAQIVSIADVYDALTSERCYKTAYSHERAVEMIRGGECGVFNPLLIECLLDISRHMEKELSKSSQGIRNEREIRAITDEILNNNNLLSSGQAAPQFGTEIIGRKPADDNGAVPVIYNKPQFNAANTADEKGAVCVQSLAPFDSSRREQEIRGTAENTKAGDVATMETKGTDFEMLKQVGINTDSAIKRFMGNEALYIKMLRKFLADDTFASLVQAVSQRCGESALSASHTLKGISGNLSMDRLFELFSQQVVLMRADKWDEAYSMMTEINENYAKIVKTLSTWLDMR